MNMSPLQMQELEANLERLRLRMPEIPVSGVLLSRLVVQVGRGMSSMLDRELRPFGLTEVEFRVLTTLFAQAEGIAHPSELCARTSQSAATISRIGDALVGRGLISRVSSTHDRRKMVLTMTEQGEELVRQLLPTLFDALREMFKDFSVDEQQRLIAQLKRLGSMLSGPDEHDDSERAE